MDIPQRGADGKYLTINRQLTEDELVWHFRSGWNVAALNCTAPQYQPILDGYSAFIKDHARSLKRLNDRIDAVYRREIGSRRAAIRAREAQMTSVYNFWALPPVRAGFCSAALDISSRALAAPPSDPVAFAKTNFDQLEAPFETFFAEYQAYRQLSAQWDAEYGQQYGSSQPGWVAAQSERASGTSVVTDRASGDSATGQGNFVSQPVVEPYSNAGDQRDAQPASTPRGLR